MQIIELKPSELLPYENNPRDNSEAVDKVMASIRSFGFRVPIVIDAANVIIAGHTRWLAAQKLGLASVPCLRADDLSPEQVRAFRLADNRVSEFAKWDKALLREELRALEGLSLDMGDFGFGYADIREVKEDAYSGSLPESPVSKPGDLYQLGRHRLLCGDATNSEAYGLLLGDELADLVVTDPPYNVDYIGKGVSNSVKIKNDKMRDEAFKAFITSAFKCMRSYMEPGASFYSFMASESFRQFRESVDDSGLEYHQLLIWVKNTMVLGRSRYQQQFEPILFCANGSGVAWYGDRKQKTVIESVDLMDEFQLRQFVKDQWEGSDVLRAKKPATSKLHPTMKPIKLLEILLRNSSREHDVVLDPFGGSGSTLIACEQMGRRCFMLELEPAYIDVIIDRWQQYTGQTAVKLN